jgi:hypothetical protein
LAEGSVFYSSLTLVAMGCLALVLSIIFRLRFRRLEGLPRDLNASVFDRTFNVFDPYPVRIKVAQRFLTALPLIAGIGAILLRFVVWSIAASGLIISVFIIIIGLNLIMIEEAPEIYTNSKVFAKAVEKNVKFAGGDLKVLQLIRKLSLKLARYYLGLAIFFMALSITLQYIWNALPSLLTNIVHAIEQSSGSYGMAIVEVVAVILALNLTLLQFVAFKVKNRMFSYKIE